MAAEGCTKKKKTFLCVSRLKSQLKPCNNIQYFFILYFSALLFPWLLCSVSLDYSFSPVFTFLARSAGVVFGGSAVNLLSTVPCRCLKFAPTTKQLAVCELLICSLRFSVASFNTLRSCHGSL